MIVQSPLMLNWKTGNEGFSLASRTNPLDRTRHRAQSRLVQHIINTCTSFLTIFWFADVSLDEGETLPLLHSHHLQYFIQITLTSSGKLVQPNHFLIVTQYNRSLPPSFQVRSEGRKEGEPSENVHSRDAMTEPTWMYSRRFSEGSPLFLPGV